MGLGWLFWGAAGSARVVGQVPYRPALTPSDFGLPYEPARLLTGDGFRLEAWRIPHPRPTGALILIHGFTACKADLLDFAREMHRAFPFDLLLLDLRAHGFSGGRSISFGLREVLDVQAALEALGSDPRTRGLPVGCYGVSMGGAVAFHAAARFPSIRAVVSDSCYSDLAETIATSQRLTYHIPRFPLGQAVVWGTELRLGCRLSDLSPTGVIGQIAPRPVFLIHAGRDKTIPPEHGKRLYEAARDPRQFWVVPGAEHAAGFYVAKQEYVQKVGRFFSDAFLRAA
ncbi:MAG: alpha/beta hydrolase [Candidatus Omnitrophica bacterium]|nr:alpha/beta hydrolase [Candidatus Omnitrophota bacterium]